MNTTERRVSSICVMVTSAKSAYWGSLFAALIQAFFAYGLQREEGVMHG